VRQDPSDEPTSVLLERIKAEKAKREAEGKAKKGSRKKAGKRSRQKKQPRQLELL
jgi:type I restriction enzyme S subunit